MSFIARRAGVAVARNLALRRSYASEAGVLSGPSFKLSEDQEAYQGEAIWDKDPVAIVD